jgi:hypothetical protein
MPIYEVDDRDEELLAADAAPAEDDSVIKEPSPEASAPKAAKPSKHETADALAAGFWEIHKASTAQSFLAVRGVVRTAIANGLDRDDVARALDRIAREGRAISGGSITVALGQIRNGAGAIAPYVGGYPAKPSTTDQRVAAGLALADYYRSRGE